MIRAVLFLFVAVLALGWLDQHLETEAASERASRAKVGRFVSEEEVSKWKIGCFEVADASGNRIKYLPYFGRWRCFTAEGAPVDTQALQAMFTAITQTEGVVQSSAPRDPAEYGIGTPSTWRVTFHGQGALQAPHSDPIVSFDLGTPRPERGTCFVRRVGESAVWLLDSNPRAALDAPPIPGLPPLLTPFVIPSDWAGWQTGLARVRIEQQGSTPIVLEKRVPPPSSNSDPRQGPTHIWVLDPGLTESIAASLQSTAYTLFLSRVPYLNVRGPKLKSPLGLDQPRTSLLLEAPDTEPLRLLLGAPLPDGRVPLWNEETARAYLLSAEVAGLLVPPRQVFQTESEKNPWDPYLRQN